jgi:hypothetical protein
MVWVRVLPQETRGNAHAHALFAKDEFFDDVACYRVSAENKDKSERCPNKNVLSLLDAFIVAH